MLPNLLTILRLFAGIVYPFVTYEWRMALLVYAAVSDLIDGWIGRRLHQTSTLGQVLDPIADKTCVVAVILTLLLEGKLQLWELVLIAARDIAVLVLAIILLLTQPGRFQEMQPRLSGKVATAAQFVFLIWIVIFEQRVGWLFLVTVLVSTFAAVDYSLFAIKNRRTNH